MKVSDFHLFSTERKGIGEKSQQQKHPEEKEDERSVREMTSFTSALEMKPGCNSGGVYTNKWNRKVVDKFQSR